MRLSPAVRNVLIAILLAVVLPGALLIAAGGGESTAARNTDGAFIAAMIPHHQAATEMAGLARERSRRPEIKRLAEQISSVQTGEVQQLDALHRGLFGRRAPARPMAHGGLGLTEDEMGMGMGKGMTQLEGAADFDRAFINAMITHHQGAIRMARVELRRGGDAELKRVARRIVTAQSREIRLLNRWHASWYGSAAPAGGVPGS